MIRYRYGISIWEIGRPWDINMEYGLSIWVTVCRYGYLPYRYGHAGYRYGIWPNDMVVDGIDMVILHIDLGDLVTLFTRPCHSEHPHLQNETPVPRLRRLRQV
jgi:hypothetical protein